AAAPAVVRSVDGRRDLAVGDEDPNAAGTRRIGDAPEHPALTRRGDRVAALDRRHRAQRPQLSGDLRESGLRGLETAVDELGASLHPAIEILETRLHDPLAIGECWPAAELDDPIGFMPEERGEPPAHPHPRLRDRAP